MDPSLSFWWKKNRYNCFLSPWVQFFKKKKQKAGETIAGFSEKRPKVPYFGGIFV